MKDLAGAAGFAFGAVVLAAYSWWAIPSYDPIPRTLVMLIAIGCAGGSLVLLWKRKREREKEEEIETLRRRSGAP